MNVVITDYNFHCSVLSSLVEYSPALISYSLNIDYVCKLNVNLLSFLSEPVITNGGQGTEPVPTRCMLQKLTSLDSETSDM
jgi:hypothetical protein